MRTKASVTGKMDRFKACQYDRVGLKLRAEMFVVQDTSGDAAKFTALARKVPDGTGASLILKSDKVDVLKAAASAVEG